MPSTTTTYVPVVINTTQTVHTSVQINNAPLAAVTQAATSRTLTVGSPGPQGPAGTGGSGGGAAQNLFISNTPPTSPPTQYVWIQTGLGASGQDMTWWVQP